MTSSNDKGGGCPVAVGAGARVGVGAMRDVALATTYAVGGDKTKKKKRPTLFRGGIWNLYKNGLGGRYRLYHIRLREWASGRSLPDTRPRGHSRCFLAICRISRF